MLFVFVVFVVVCFVFVFFFFKQKTAYEIRPRDWSSDVCSSDQKGPHRADLVMKIDGRAAADYLSGGQQKLAACSLLLAQASVFNQYKQESCVILVDDLPSELDVQHRHLFMDLLYSIGGQVFVTATDSNLLQLTDYPEKKTFHVEHGCVSSEREDGV